MFKTAANLIKILVRSNGVSAKDYLREKLVKEEDKLLLSEFGQYTIEALVVHVLGMVFSQPDSNPIVRVATLIDQLESSVRTQASLLKSRRSQKPYSNVTNEVSHDGNPVNVRKRSKKEMTHPFGTCLVQFMVERKMINLMSDPKGSVRVKKKENSYFLPTLPLTVSRRRTHAFHSESEEEEGLAFLIRF